MNHPMAATVTGHQSQNGDDMQAALLTPNEAILCVRKGVVMVDPLWFLCSILMNVDLPQSV